MKRRPFKEPLPNECAELFNYDPAFTIRSMMSHSTSPQLPKGKNIPCRCYIDSSHTPCTHSSPAFQIAKKGKK